VLRDRSIEATYSGGGTGGGAAKAKCVTSDGVDFRVRLYRGRNAYRHGIIVEVQRRFGSSFAFHRDTQAILDAAVGGKGSAAVPAVPPPPTLSLSPATIPLVTDSEGTAHTDEEEEEGGEDAPGGSSSSSSSSSSREGGSALAAVAKMLSHGARDGDHLAYQTLLPLTSPARIGRATARSVSIDLLRPGNPVGAHVLGLVLRPHPPPPQPQNAAAAGIWDDDMESEAEDDDNMNEEGRDEDAFRLRTMALEVLANAVQATKGRTLPGELVEELGPVLRREIETAAAHPRRAQIAAACAESLLAPGGGRTDFFGGDDLVDALERAVEVGRVRHAGLRLQAQRCLDRIRRM
jgi:hypothetical protein